MPELPMSSTLTLRDYIRVYFRQKWVILVTFALTMGLFQMFISLRTPVYQAQVTLLITGERKIEASYYKEAVSAYSQGASTVALTQSEIVLSNPVIERAVRALKIHERPADYERQFASPLKVRVMDLMAGFDKAMQSWEDQKPSAQDPAAMNFRAAVEGLKSNIEVAPVKNTNLLVLEVLDFSPVEAARIANVVSRSYIIFDLEQQLAEYKITYGETHQIVRQLFADMTRMNERLLIDPKTNIEAIGPASVKIIAPATVPLDPVPFLGKKKWMTMLIGLFLSALASIAMALVVEFADPSFRSPQDVEQQIQLPYLGFIPKVRWHRPKLVSDITRKDPFTEAFQKLTDQIYILLKGKKLKSLLALSAMPREGSQLMIANLGIFLARKFHKKTLLLDANLRNPSMHKVFNQPLEPGLAEVLDGKTGFADAVKDLEPKLAFLSAGRAAQDPVALLSSPKMTDLLKQAQEHYDMVLIDCAHLNRYKDGELLSLHVDSMVYVVSEGSTRRQIVKHVVRRWENSRSNLLGLILSNRQFFIPSIVYKRI